MIYYTVTSKGRIYLVFVYPKNEQENLTEDQKKVLKKLTEILI